MTKTKNAISSIFAAPQASWQYLKESRDELKKVVWPDRETTLRYTGIVIFVSLLVGLVIGGVDYLLQKAMELFL